MPYNKNKRLIALIMALMMGINTNTISKEVILKGDSSEIGVHEFNDFDDYIELEKSVYGKKLSYEDVIFLGLAQSIVENCWLSARHPFSNKKESSIVEQAKADLHYEEMYEKLQKIIYPYLEELYEYVGKNSYDHMYKTDIYEEDKYYYSKEGSIIGDSRFLTIALPTYGQGMVEVVVSNYKNVPDKFKDFYMRVDPISFKVYNAFDFCDGDMTIRTRYSDSLTREVTYQERERKEDAISPKYISKENNPLYTTGDGNNRKKKKIKSKVTYKDSYACNYKEPKNGKYPKGCYIKRGGYRN